MRWTQDSFPDAARIVPHDAMATEGWVHVVVRLTPQDGGNVLSEATLIAGDTSTTTTVPASWLGDGMRFGVLLPYGVGPAQVYVDDVVCHITD